MQPQPRRLFLIALLAGALLVSVASASASGSHVAYVAGQVGNGGLVSAIDTATNRKVDFPERVGKLLKAGEEPGSVAITPDGRFAYVASFDREGLPVFGAVSVIDLATHKAIEVPDGGTTIAMGSNSKAVAIAPDGRFAYVANEEPFNGDASTTGVSVIDTATNEVLEVPDGERTIKVGEQPTAIAFTPDSKFAYVAVKGLNGVGDGVAVIDTATNEAITVPGGTKLIEVGDEPDGLAVTPNGEFVYVTNQAGGVSVIRTETNEAIEVPDGNKLIQVGIFPNGIAITPDGKFAYVVNTGGGVSVVDTSTNRAIDVPDGNRQITVGTLPVQISITPDGKFAYVTNFIGGTVSVIDTATHEAIEVPDGNRQIQAFPLETGHPTGVAITPDGKFAIVANAFEPDNGLVVIDTSTNQLVDVPDGNEQIKVGQAPRAVAITPDGDFAYVANFGLNGFSQGVSVIDTATNEAIAVPDGEELIKVGNKPDGVAITPDGKFAYVANFGGGVSVIDTAFNQAIELRNGNRVIKPDARATAVAITPDGKFAYVAISASVAGEGVSVIETSTNEPIDVPNPNQLIEVGGTPRAISITPNGRFAYVVVEGGGVAVIDTSTNEAIRLADRKKLIEVGHNPDAIAITPDGKLAYVANFDGNGVSVIDTSTNRVIEVPDGEEIKVESGEPVGIAIAPGGHFAYVTNRGGGTTVIDTATNQAIEVPDGNRTIKVGGQPIGIAITPDQAPTASFAQPAKAQAEVRASFDASASADADGAVASYVWDFGDGQTMTLTAPTATHVFAAPGTYQVTLRVVDTESCSTEDSFTGQTVLCNGSPAAQVTRTIEVEPSPPLPGNARPSNLFGFGKLVLNRHRGNATLSVSLPGPGSVVLRGRGIRPRERTATSAGTLKLVVNPTGASLRRLRRSGRVGLRAEVIFTPQGGEPARKIKSLTLRRKPIHRPRAA